MKSWPFSTAFAGFGVALLALGVAGMFLGEDAGDRLIGSLVAISASFRSSTAVCGVAPSTTTSRISTQTPKLGA